MKIGNFLSKNEQARNKPAEGKTGSEMIDYTTKGVSCSLRARDGAIRAFLAVVLLCLSVGGCKTVYVPIETGTTVNVKDSVRWEIKDSVRITEATRYRDMAWLGDSLKIEGARSRMWAVADTTREALIGGLEEDRVEEKTRIVYKDRWKVRDSIVFKEIPKIVEKPVEVIKIPWIYKVLSAVGLLSIIGIALWVLWKYLRNKGLLVGLLPHKFG